MPYVGMVDRPVRFSGRRAKFQSYYPHVMARREAQRQWWHAHAGVHALFYRRSKDRYDVYDNLIDLLKVADVFVPDACQTLLHHTPGPRHPAPPRAAVICLRPPGVWFGLKLLVIYPKRIAYRLVWHVKQFIGERGLPLGCGRFFFWLVVVVVLSVCVCVSETSSGTHTREFAWYKVHDNDDARRATMRITLTDWWKTCWRSGGGVPSSAHAQICLGTRSSCWYDHRTQTHTLALSGARETRRSCCAHGWGAKWMRSAMAEWQC